MQRPVTKATVGLAVAGLVWLAAAAPSVAEVVPDAGITYGPPLRLSAYADLRLGGGPWVPSVGGQVGFGGSSFSLGLGRTSHSGLPDDPTYLGLRAVTTLTGNSPLHALPRSTYAGLHGEIGLLWTAKLEVGVDTRIGRGRRDTRFVWGISVSPILLAFIAAMAGMHHFPGT
jgi:hypothetical protein